MPDTQIFSDTTPVTGLAANFRLKRVGYAALNVTDVERTVALSIDDPDGMLWAYTLGMEQFPETGARLARFMSVSPEDYDLWGAKPKPSFAGAGGVITSDE